MFGTETKYLHGYKVTSDGSFINHPHTLSTSLMNGTVTFLIAEN